MYYIHIIFGHLCCIYNSPISFNTVENIKIGFVFVKFCSNMFLRTESIHIALSSESFFFLQKNVTTNNRTRHDHVVTK